MADNAYSVGIKRSRMNSRIPKAPHIYQIDVINGDNFIEELLETMAVALLSIISLQSRLIQLST